MGSLWLFTERKSHCRGSGKDWPVGVEESLPYPKIAFVEGAPDFLAVFQFIFAEGKEEDCGTLCDAGIS